MVKKIFGFFYKETGGLNQAAMLLGLFAFLSQVLAFLRDRLLAHIFGAGTDLDIYYAAFRIPDFIFVTVASVVSLSVLIPFILEKDASGREALREFIDGIFSFFGLLIATVSILAYFSMPYLGGLLFKGLPPEALEEVVFLSRLLLLSPIILGFSNLFGSLTQAYNRFTIYALSPILYNAGIIFGILLLAERFGVEGVVWGVIMGALLHALVQVPFVVKAGLFPRVSGRFDLALVGRVVRISLPRTLTLAMSSLALIFLVSLASLMSSGSISILSFSNNLQSIPLSIIGVSYSLAAFPTLSRRFQEKNIEAFIEQMAATARFIIFWSLPFTALLIVLRAQFVRVVLGTGMFDWNATRLTAAALAIFVLSSVFQSLMLLLMRGFYSAGHTKKPFYINLLSTGILATFAYILVKLFYSSAIFSGFVSVLLKVENLPDTAVLMLPLAFSLGTIINGVLLWAAFEKEFPGFSRQCYRTAFESFGVAVIMGATAYVGLSFMENFLATDTLIGLLLQSLGAGLLAIAAGVAIFITLKSQELALVWSSIQERFWKAKVIATDPEIV
jgi:putative peptidoglycan lipid II flippase